MKIDRIGLSNINCQGCEMKIIEYNNAKNIIIEFQDKYKAKINTAYKEFKNGSIKNPYYPSVYNVGYLGQGKYKTRDENGEQIKSYIMWRGILERCYSERNKKIRPTYNDCSVCEEWHNYQNFAKWYEENYYEIHNQKMHLDKDILIKGNKIYSPNTCVFVPDRINVLFTKRQNCRGEYPIGVHMCKRDKALISSCSVDGENKHLGYFPLNKPFQAFYTYKIFKEQYIKQIADEYKDLIPLQLYEAMYNYEIEIND